MLSSQYAKPDGLGPGNHMSAVNPPTPSSANLGTVYGFATPGSSSNAAASSSTKSSVPSVDQPMYTNGYADVSRGQMPPQALNSGLAYGFPYPVSHAQFQPVYLSYGGLQHPQHQQPQYAPQPAYQQQQPQMSPLYANGPAQNVPLMAQNPQRPLNQGDQHPAAVPSSPMSIPQGNPSYSMPLVASSAPANLASGMAGYRTTGTAPQEIPASTKSLGPGPVDTMAGDATLMAGANTNPANASLVGSAGAGSSRPGIVVFNPRNKDPPLGKRTKVSRACDECRRKKTRCDFDADREVCSPCRRACVQCTFERAQLKRGPARKRHSQGVLPSPELSSSSSKFSPPNSNFSLSNYNAHLNTFNYSRARSRSTSSAVADGLLPPIESLLSQHNGFMNGKNPSLQMPSELASRSPARHSPSSSSATASSPTGPIAGHSNPHNSTSTTTGTTTSTSTGPTTDIAAKKSSFPLLVEVACRQSESPTSEDSAASPSTPTSATMATDNSSSITAVPPSSPISKMEVSDGGKSSLKMSPSSSKTVTPPPQYDAAVHGISHNALMRYYTFVHPTFPLLPDLIADFDEMFKAAGPAKDYLVAALNGNSEVMVPLGLGNISPTTDSVGAQQQSTIRESHLISLLFMYMKTLDTAWLGAGVAACATLLKDPLSRRAKHLTALVVAFDCIHSALFDLPSFVPTYFAQPAIECERMRPLLELLQWGTEYKEAAGRAQHFVTAPEAALTTLGQLKHHQITKADAKVELEKLLPQLQHTPLEIFVKQLKA